MELSRKLTLMIQTCDAFSDLWEPHFRLLEESWPNRPVRTVLVTDAPTDAVFPGVEVLSAGEGKQFPARLAAALPRIETDYILLTLDDYFPICPISTEKLSRLVALMDGEKLDYIRLFSDPNSFRKAGPRGLYEIDLTENYAVNLYPGLWRTDFLARTLGRDTDIWTYEVSLTHAARRLKARCRLSKGREFPILDVVRKGKLLHRANGYLKRRKLYHGPRQVISRWEELRIYIFTTGKRVLPRPAQAWVKARLRRRGFRFYSDQIPEEPYDQIAAV